MACFADGDRGENPKITQTWLKKIHRYALRSISTNNDGEEGGYSLAKDEEDGNHKEIDYGSDTSR